MISQRLSQIERLVAGLSMISVPLLLLIGFVLQPRFWSFEITSNASILVDAFRHQVGFHTGHLLVMFAVAPILVTIVRFRTLLQRRGAVFGVVGGLIAGFGAVAVAIDKGALTLVLTAFDALSDAEITQITPALQVIADRSGWLMVTWLIVLLPIGAALQVWGLRREGYVRRWQAIATITGLLLLINPDIEIISAAGALLMCTGYLPLGLHELQGRFARAFVPSSFGSASRH